MYKGFHSFILIAPYATWMVLMTLLPQTAGAYALRGLATLLALAVGAFLSRRCPHRRHGERIGAEGSAETGLFVPTRQIPTRLIPTRLIPTRLIPACLVGALVGLLVFIVWIAPEPWLWPASPLSSPSPIVSSSPYVPAVCGWGLTLAKLCASAFVISIAEELFFRKWIVEFAGFGWMLVLFGVEHMRWDLGIGRGCVFIAEGVFAGLAYGLLAKRHGLLSAIVAHAVTNLVLGLYVIGWDKWFYW